jgi:tetratricopeptide (TPR) repeat protein
VRQSDLADPADNAAPEVALARGTALGRFVVLGLVGRGAMGEVYGAYDPDLDRKIAIKLVLAAAGDADDTSEGRTRLMREAQATAKVSHPNVVIVYDAGTFGDRVFIAMEFIEGHTLRYWLQERERSVADVLDIFLAAGRGLAAAHEKELVHRDFKPDNVMVSASGQVRVMDFGLARIADGRPLAPDAPRPVFKAPGPDDPPVNLEATPILGAPILRELAKSTSTIAFRDKITATGALLGTPAYMSPEQFQGRLADARSDQFSFCVALYEALFGTRPFAGRTLDELAMNVMGGNLDTPAESRGVPARVRRVLEQGLRTHPEERFPSMNALLAELEQGVGGGRGGFAAQAAAKLVGVWEAPVAGQPVSTPEKEAIRRAFLATGKGYAPAAFASTSATLDRYAERWAELYVEVCEATHVRGEQSAEILDLRMSFLTEGLDDLKALCRVFREATPEVVSNAERAASSLANLERSRDVTFVRNAVRPPQDFVTRVAVENLRGQLAEVRALLRVGRLTDGVEEAKPLVAEARRVAYDPLLAEALLVAGTLEYEANRFDRAIEFNTEAFSAAQMARHDEVAAEAAINIMGLEGYQRGRFDVSEVWARYAETLLRRMGSHDLLWGWYHHNRSTVRQMQGRLSDSVEDAQRALDWKTRARGPRSFDTALSIMNLANNYAYMGDFEAAVDTAQRGIAILTEAIGAEHPWTAIALGNLGQFLYRLGRYEEAREVAAVSLTHGEREAGPLANKVSYPLRTLGLCTLALGRPDEARNFLERAAAIRAAEKMPLRLAEVHFPLARALFETGARKRGVALARQARGEYERAASTPLVERDLAELDLWLAEHEPLVKKKTGAKKPPKSVKSGARPKPRRAPRAGRAPV